MIPKKLPAAKAVSVQNIQGMRSSSLPDIFETYSKPLRTAGKNLLTCSPNIDLQLNFQSR